MRRIFSPSGNICNLACWTIYGTLCMCERPYLILQGCHPFDLMATSSITAVEVLPWTALIGAFLASLMYGTSSCMLCYCSEHQKVQLPSNRVFSKILSSLKYSWVYSRMLFVPHKPWFLITQQTHRHLLWQVFCIEKYWPLEEG
jgi:hypothetical protein